MSAKTREQLEERQRTVRNALVTASERYRSIPRDRPHHDERIEWGLIKDACKRELQSLKGQITKAFVRERLRA